MSRMRITWPVLVAVAAFAVPAVCLACPAPPPAVVDIVTERPYGDKGGTVLDHEADAKNKELVKPLTEFLQHVTQDADRAWKHPGKPDAASGQCAAGWIAAWAKGNAWLGKMGSKQSEYQRKWDLAGVALAYLKVKRFATPEQRAVIEPWLVRFADATRAFFDDPGVKRNNHWYWEGLALGAVGLAADSPRHWDMARGVIKDATSEVAANGSLAMELARTARASHYHAFALMPLVTLATLAKSKGEDFYAFNGGAIDRLADLTARGLADPSVFAALAGAAQSADNKPGAGWSQLYALHKPGSPAARIAMSHAHRWLGGDVQLLVRALAK